MKKLAIILTIGFLAFTSDEAAASDVWVVEIVSTQAAPKNNLTTAAPVTLREGVTFVIQCDKATRVTVGKDSTAAASATSYYVDAVPASYEIPLVKDVSTGILEKVIATYPVNSGDTSTCEVYRVTHAKR